MSDALRRGTRTLLDVSVVTAIVQALVEFGVDLTAGQRAVLVSLGTFLVSAVKNMLEDQGTIPALLKAPPSPGANPVPDDLPRDDYPTTGAPEAGRTDLVGVALLVVILVGLRYLGVI